MNPELDRIGNAVDERAAELRAWGESVHTVNELLELKAQARDFAKIFNDIADEVMDRVDMISEGE